MSAHFISLLLFFHCILFGSISYKTHASLLSHHIKNNVNNLSDGLLSGLIIFGLLPHLTEHWLHHGYSTVGIGVIIIAPIVLALAFGRVLKQASQHIALITFLIFITHAFIEGIALGTSYLRAEFTLILMSLLLHKSVESFCFINQIARLLKQNFYIILFILFHALSVLIGFEIGINLKHFGHSLHNIELYFDVGTVSSLIFLIFFCTTTRHDDKCSHGWNKYSVIGFISSGALVSLF